MKYGRTVSGAAIMLLVLGLWGCGKDEVAKPQGNQPPIINRVQIAPPAAKVGQTISSVVESEDKELDPVELQFEWYMGGEKTDQTGPTFDTSGGGEGSVVYFRVRAKEINSNRASEWVESDRVVLSAAPPPKLKAVAIDSERIFSYTDAKAVVDYGDVDPADVDQVYYHWLVNGKLLDPEQFDTDELDSSNFKRGDKLQVLACTDGKFNSSTMVSSPIRTVLNATPELGEPNLVQNGGLVNVYLSASDPDGDRLQFFLENPPPNTTINPNTGVVTVNFAKLAQGEYTLNCGVDDGHGGRTTYQTSFSK